MIITTYASTNVLFGRADDIRKEEKRGEKRRTVGILQLFQPQTSLHIFFYSLVFLATKKSIYRKSPWEEYKKIDYRIETLPGLPPFSTLLSVGSSPYIYHNRLQKKKI